MRSIRHKDVVEAALANTFMANANVPGEEYTYAWLFCWIGEKYDINPVALAKSCQTRTGAGTSDLISGKYSGYEGLIILTLSDRFYKRMKL